MEPLSFSKNVTRCYTAVYSKKVYIFLEPSKFKILKKISSSEPYWSEFERMTVSEIYVEPGKSGKSITGREVFQKMLDDISTDQVDTDFVVVFKLSRFGRNAKDTLNSLTYLQRYGVNLICKE